MIDHDKNVGQLLNLLDKLGIADDTIVMYSTDNGPHMNTWPDGAMTPFRSEKNTNWEGAFPRSVDGPLARKDPGRRRVQRDRQHHDWLPTFLAAAGEPDVVDKLKEGTRRPARRSRCTSTATTCCPTSPARSTRPRKGLIYFGDDGDLVALRFDNWKMVFMEQRCRGNARTVGRAVHCSACRSCSTCAPIRSSGPT